MKLSAISPRNIRWGRWINLSIAILIGWTLFQLFGPNPRIIISEETTVISRPLRSDGLPDYKSYWRNLGREGITPENNGAVLFWQAMWPGDLEQEDWLPMCEALGLEDIPAAENGSLDPFGKDLEREVGVWLMQQLEPKFTPQNSKLTIQQLDRLYYRAGSERTIQIAMERPWTSGQLPILTAWLSKHEEQFELLIAASKRSRFWSPSPSVLNTIDENTGFMKMPMSWTMPKAFRALMVRAMWHLGEKRTEDSWRDLQACFRLANLISQGNSIYNEQCVMRMQTFTCHRTITLLHHGNPDSRLAQKILAEICKLRPMRKVALAVDQETRIYYADSAIGQSTGRDKLFDLSGGQISFYFEPSEHLRIDWNHVLRQGTYWHKKLFRAVSQPTRRERLVAFKEYYEQIAELDASFRSNYQAVKGLVSEREHLMTGILLWCVWPDVEETCDVADETETTLRQAQIAAALAVYRTERGEYPISLDTLVPNIVKSIPNDPYSETGFKYSRKPDGGYMLYSMYENGIDDGANDARSEIVNGEWVNEVGKDFNYEKTDLVIRVPVPRIVTTPENVNLSEATHY